MKKIVIFLFIAVFIGVPSVLYADATIGNGLTCQGSTILNKKGKEVKYSKAKSTLETTLAKLKEKKAGAPKNKKAAIQTQINEIKQSKVLLTACFKGTLSSDQVDPLFTNLASGNGTYSGNYQANVDFVGAISGSATMQFTLNGTTFSAVLSLGGELNNALNGNPLDFSGDVGGIGFPAVFTLQNTFLGNVTLTFEQDGHLVITNDIAGKKVNFDAQLSGSSISGSVSGVYTKIVQVNYSGSFTATK